MVMTAGPKPVKRQKRHSETLNPQGQVRSVLMGQRPSPCNRLSFRRFQGDRASAVTTMSQLLLNRFHCGRPDKGFWIFIPNRQKLANSLLQVFHAAEGSTSDSF